jgi:hypothetical protein
LFLSRFKLFLHRCAFPFSSRKTRNRAGGRGKVFSPDAALQQKIRLFVADLHLDSTPIGERGGYAMGLTRPVNALIICAAFAFIGALILGVLP